jgi:hypothetical protein
MRGLKVMSGLSRESSVLSERLNNLQERWDSGELA